MSSLPQLGALNRWHEEMRSGTRGHPDRWITWLLDDVWSAACAEKTAIDLFAEGDLHRAKYFMDCALLRLNGCMDAPDTMRGKILLAKLRSKGPTEPRQPIPFRRARPAAMIPRWT